MVGKLLFQNKISEFKQWFLTIPLSELNIYVMKREDLEQWVKDLMEMNKHFIKENEELKRNLREVESYSSKRLISGMRVWIG